MKYLYGDDPVQEDILCFVHAGHAACAYFFQYLVVCGHTDMRKSIDGLAALVQQQFQLDLFASSAFLFCGRRRDRMKVLLWEDDGFLLLYKRLEDGKFSWPRNEQEVRNITREQFISYLMLVLPSWGKTPSEEQLDSIMPWSATLPETCHRTYHQIVENMAEVK